MINRHVSKNFLKQASEEYFKDDINRLELSTSVQSLLRVTSESVTRKSNWFKWNERIERVWGMQVATKTKLMIEDLLGIDLWSHQNAWFEPNFDSCSQEDKSILEQQGFPFSICSLSPTTYENLCRSWNTQINRIYYKVETEEAIIEIGNINSQSQRDNDKFRCIYDLLDRIFNNLKDKEDSNIDRERFTTLIHDFHFFAVQYHYISFRKMTEEDSQIFEEVLDYFLGRVGEFWIDQSVAL